ncbi:MAG: 30S ribosome-binding factor RbfA [Tissierellia bacterium]|nr:30S ribosome-binding factor RbfA [Tissierellia bacterium]
MSEELKREISDIVQNKIKDPRISPIVSISKVNVTGDLSFATVGVSVLGDKREREETLKGLESAKGFIKKELGKNLKLRAIPELIFENDESIEKSMEMFKLIEEVNHDEK